VAATATVSDTDFSAPVTSIMDAGSGVWQSAGGSTIALEWAADAGDHAHTLSDFLVPTLSIECEPCGRFGRYNVAKLIEQLAHAATLES
jgi:hypothetical protein